MGRKLKGKISKISVGRNLEFGMVSAALQEAGGVKSHAARILGCSTSALSKYIKEDSQLQEIQLSARDTMIDIAEEGLMNALKREDMRAILFTLKTIGKERGYTSRQEITGENGTPLNAPTESSRQAIMAQLQSALESKGYDASTLEPVQVNDIVMERDKDALLN